MQENATQFYSTAYFDRNGPPFAHSPYGRMEHKSTTDNCKLKTYD